MTPSSSKFALSLLAFAAFALAPAAPAAPAPARPPNVIIIVSDNQGYHDLGCYGNPAVKSPNLDHLAAEGVKATSFYITSGECTPSRGSILTGRYPQRNGLTDMIRDDMVNYKHQYTEAEYAISPEMTLGLDLREITLGNLAQSAGYATAVVGKWDSGRARRFLPLQRGFDFFYGFANSGADYRTGERYGIPSTFRNNELETPHGYSEELFTQEALHFIDRSQDRPFLLYLAYHTPAGNASLQSKVRHVPQQYMDLFPNLPATDKRKEYLATIACMDDGIGQIVTDLKRLKLDRNTLIIFFPDNGAGSGGADCSPYKCRNGQDNQIGEGGIRTCFVAWWPGVLPAGATSGEFISALDVFPTVAAISGAKLPADLVLDGFNLIPVLQGKIPSPRSEMFFQSRDGRAARVGRYKWLVTPHSTGLFDLDQDPGEDRDLSADHPDVLASVKARWENWRRDMDQTEPRGPFRDY